MPRLFRPPHTTSQVLIWLGSALILGLVAVTVTIIWQSRNRTLATATARTANVAGLLANDTARDLRLLDRLVDRARQDLARQRYSAARERHKTLRSYDRTLPFLDGFLLTDPNGRLTASSRRHPPPALDLSDRPHVARLLAGTGDALALTPPMADPSSGRRLAALSRPLIGQDQRPAGVLIAMLDPNWFARLYDDVLLPARGTIVLLDAQGDPLFSSSTANPAVLPSPHGWLIAVQAVPGTDLSLVVGVNRDAILAPWRHNALILAAAGVGGAFALAIALWLLVGRLDREAQSTEQLRQSENRYRELIESTPSPIIGIDPAGRIEAFNPAAETAFGLSRDRAMGRPFIALVAGDPDRPAVAEQLGRARGGRGPVRLDAYMIGAAGDRRMVVWSLSPTAGRAPGLVAIGHDITERQRLASELTEKTGLLEQAIAIADIGSWRLDIASGRIQGAPRFLRIMGLPPQANLSLDQMLGHLHAADRRLAEQHIAKAIETHQAFALEVRLATDTGEDRVVMIRGQCEGEGDGAPGSLVAVVQDVTERTRSRDRLHQANVDLARVNRELQREIAERRRVESALRESEAVARATFDLAAAGIAHTALDGTFLAVNDCFCRIAGRNRQTLLALRWQEITDPQDLDDSEDIAAALMAGATGRTLEKRFLRPDGESIWVRMSVSLVRDDHQRPRHFIAIAEDISEHKALESALRRAKMAADTASLAKSRFLATMSHELRTPLNAILGFSELIKGEVFGPLGQPRYLEYIEDIHTSGVHLLRVINDILDIAKIETGRLTIAPERLDPLPALETCLRGIAARAGRHGQTLETDFADDLPVLFADPRAFNQILYNLLSNAVRFTPDGGRVCLRARGTADGGLEVAVIDTGIGIRDEDMERILKPFEQVDNRYGRSAGGTGLGLSLVKALMDLHHGHLTLVSQPGAGTTARLYFPPPPTDVPS